MDTFHNNKSAQRVWNKVLLRIPDIHPKLIFFVGDLLDTIDDKAETSLEEDNLDAGWMGQIEDLFTGDATAAAIRGAGLLNLASELERAQGTAYAGAQVAYNMSQLAYDISASYIK